MSLKVTDQTLSTVPAVDGGCVKGSVAVSLTVKNAAKLLHLLHDVITTAKFLGDTEGKFFEKVRYSTRICRLVPKT